MTIQRNVFFIADRLGRPNSSLLFEHGFATVEPRGVYFNPATGFTVMFWIKPLSTNYFQQVIDFGNGFRSDNIRVGFFENSLTLYCLFYADEENRLYDNLKTPDGLLVLGEWVHVTVLHDFRFYRVFLNGSQVVERRDEYKYSMVPRGSNFVGANNWPSDELLHAELDELKIFDRPLSPDEIIQEMHKGQ